MTIEFLPRAHSERLGQLDESNWRKLDSKSSFDRIDPAIRDIVSLLNEKGYTTFSSCSGGHKTDLRKKIDRHESGYLAFSPPSRGPFILYLALRGKNRDFGFEVEAALDDGNGGGSRWEVLCTRLYWRLLDKKSHRVEYYTNLFAEMKRIIGLLPRHEGSHEGILAGLFGREKLPIGLRIVRSQMRRFASR